VTLDDQTMVIPEKLDPASRPASELRRQRFRSRVIGCSTGRQRGNDHDYRRDPTVDAHRQRHLPLDGTQQL